MARYLGMTRLPDGRWYPTIRCDLCEAPITTNGRVLWNAGVGAEVVLTGIVFACSDRCETTLRGDATSVMDWGTMPLIRFQLLLASATGTSAALSEQIDDLERIDFERQAQMPVPTLKGGHHQR